MKERTILVFIFTAILCFAARFILPEEIAGETRIRQFWIDKTFASPGYDLVIIGDSRAYRGVDPMTIYEGAPGKKALNFGYSSGGFSSQLLTEGISKLNPEGDRIVLLCITPFSLTKEACANDHLRMEMKRKKEDRLETRYFRDLMLFFDPVRISSLTGAGGPEKELAYHEEYREGGWVASWKEKYTYKETCESYLASFRRTSVDTLSLRSSLELIRDYTGKGYVFFAVRPPVHDSLLAVEEKFTSSFYASFARELENAGVRWISLPLTTTESYDGSHLSKQGALEFSRLVTRGMFGSR